MYPLDVRYAKLRVRVMLHVPFSEVGVGSGDNGVGIGGGGVGGGWLVPIMPEEETDEILPRPA